MNEEKKRIDDEHRAFNLLKQEEKEKIVQAKIDAKKELQVLALAKAQKLKDLREKWGPDMIAEEKKKGGSKKKKVAGEDSGGAADENLDWLDEKGGTNTKSLMDANPEINFSSDEEENDEEVQETTQPNQNQAELDELFGKDDSDIDEPNEISPSESSVKRDRNNLENDLFGDSDEDGTYDATSSINTNDAKKMRRGNVIEDDDDE
jgi:phage repressor protein C with HTH and peptisase S24 domain